MKARKQCRFLQMKLLLPKRQTLAHKLDIAK
jgi:hypothetical protein